MTNDRDGVSESDEYAELFAQIRSIYAAMVQVKTVFTVVLITMIGLAIEWRSTALVATSMFVYVVLGLALFAWRGAAGELLDRARALEAAECRLASKLVDIGYADRKSELVLLIVVFVVHVAFLTFLLLAQDSWARLVGS